MGDRKRGKGVEGVRGREGERRRGRGETSGRVKEASRDREIEG